MDHRLYKVEPFDDRNIDVTFFDGTVKRFNVGKLSKSSPEFDIFCKVDGLMSSVTIDRSRTHVKWDYNLSIDSDTLWFDGTLVEVVNIDNPHIRLAEILIRAREMTGMTQKKLETESGVGQADISKIERGEGNPSIETLSRIATALGCRYDCGFSRAETARKPLFPSERYIKYLREIKNQGQYTIGDIIGFPENIQAQLIDGVIYDHAAPGTLHQSIVGEIEYRFMEYIKANRGECKVWQNVAVTFEDDDFDYLIPDLTVVCDKEKYNENRIIGAPDFVLEVVSKDEGRHDYTVKLAKYREKGVREYWIVDPVKSKVIVHYFEEDDLPTIYPIDAEIGVNIFGGRLKVDLKSIFS